MNNSITYVAMDTHKKEHKVALHYPGDEEIVQFTVKNTVSDIRKMVNKIKNKTPANVEFCYEAGVCGFNLKRRIEALGCKCTVIAPSLTPKDKTSAFEISYSTRLYLYRRRSLDTKTSSLASRS